MERQKVGLTCITTEKPQYTDSFSAQLTSMLYTTGFWPIPFLSDIQDVDFFVKETGITAMFLIGGNADQLPAILGYGNDPITDEYRNKIELERKIIQYCLDNNIPLFGFCSGAYLIADHFGSTFIAKPNYGKALRHDAVVYGEKREVLHGFTDAVKTSSFPVSLSTSTLSDELIPFAFSEPSIVEAFHHRDKKAVGVVWHIEHDRKNKERETKVFKKIIRQHLL